MSVPSWALALPWDLIRLHAAETGLDPNLVAAVIHRESGGQPWKNRVEPNWIRFVTPEVFAPKLEISFFTEEANQRTSWGLMQVMGAVAREHGFNGDLPSLCDPSLGIQYGCLHLKWLRRLCQSEEDLICSYNHGHPERTSEGAYVNQPYVEAVSGFVKSLREVS